MNGPRLTDSMIRSALADRLRQIKKLPLAPAVRSKLIQDAHEMSAKLFDELQRQHRSWH